jgi:excinuclease ABC subunit C
MMNNAGKVLYVGKARNLKKRVSSYFQREVRDSKTRSLLTQVNDITITVTHTEGEALLLESNLIKELKPRYNILLRDDKSYPYIFLSSEEKYPKIAFHRGARRNKGKYFGPYPSAGAVRQTLNLLQKIFSIRQCDDSFFKNRSRPCLQYQIQRCTAPCINLISENDYAQDVHRAELFLQGSNSQLIDELVSSMENASEQLNYEGAAHYRDQIASVKRVQEKQYITNEKGDIDVLACISQQGIGCVQVVYIRAGLTLGHKTFFPKHTANESVESILEAFIAQYYLTNTVKRVVPPVILTNVSLKNLGVLHEVLHSRCDHKVKILSSVRGERAKWVEMAVTNAQLVLNRQNANQTNTLKRFEQLQDDLSLDHLPQRLECFDISHISGNQTVASCVVMDQNGLLKSDYRRFNIDDVTPGDDYAAMHQALLRRYTRLKKGEGKLPDVLFIDGGKGQLSKAVEVMEELQISGVTMIGVAKGEGRKPGLESLFMMDKKLPILLGQTSPALLLIQQIRDEAHRFAITGHRQRRNKNIKTSSLETISGLGPKRRQTLLKQFGGLQGVIRAGVEDLAKVSGISKKLAQKVYDTFHEQ